MGSCDNPPFLVASNTWTCIGQQNHEDVQVWNFRHVLTLPETALSIDNETNKVFHFLFHLLTFKIYSFSFHKF